MRQNDKLRLITFTIYLMDIGDLVSIVQDFARCILNFYFHRQGKKLLFFVLLFPITSFHFVKYPEIIILHLYLRDIDLKLSFP